MGVLIRRHEGIPRLTGIAKLSIIIFFATISSALIDTIWAVYLDSFFHSESIVGFFSAALTVVSFISYFLFIPFIEKTSKSRIYVYTLFSFIITYILFAINKNFYIFVILAFILMILHTFRITSFGIIVRDKSEETKLSRNEGLIYTFTNIAWVLGPLIAGYTAEKYGINIIFALAAVFVFIAFSFFIILRVNDANIKKRTDEGIVKNFVKFFNNRNRALAYVIRGGVYLWWVLIYLFIPLHIIRSGLNDLWIGYFLFAVAVPLIIFGYRFSILAGKWGFKRIFKFGFLYVAVISSSCFFITNIYIILMMLVLASIGLALLEATSEAYFFDVITKEQESRFYGPYNTSVDSSQFIGKICASLVLLALPFKYLFLLFGGFMFIMFLMSLKIKNVVEARKY
ncbi:MAG: MFS transporter [Candidatus Pacearchaeota archaeon]